jgi:hypothetical protein
VVGKVVSDIDASPTEAVFGLIKAGQPAKLTILLRGAGVARGAIRAVGSEKYVKATVTDPHRDGAGRLIAALNIVLTASAPLGQIGARVVVTSQSGSNFAVPVIATVSRFASGV